MSSSGAETAVTLSTPLGVRVLAKLNYVAHDPNGTVLATIREVEQDDDTPGTGGTPLLTIANAGTVTGERGPQGHILIMTNTSSQVNVRANNPGANNDTEQFVQTLGWFDFRGRNA